MSALATRNAVLSLGSNLDDRLASLQFAVDSLLADARVRSLVASPVYETDPLGGPEQGRYLNAVVVFETEMDGIDVLELAHTIEDARGRVRHERWGPRTLDVDVIALGDEVSNSTSLTLPHPRAAERAFVLVPWNDIDTDAQIPIRGRVAELLADVDVAVVRLISPALVLS